MKKAVIYIRVSTEKQVREGFSLEGQMEELTKYANLNDLEVVKIYVEEGKSGKSIEGREEFQQMLSDISTGTIETDFVVVYKMSRFGRSARDTLNSLHFIQDYGVHLLSKEDGLDTSKPMGNLIATILSAVAEMERDNIIVQTSMGKETKARKGGFIGGICPYGYEKDYENEKFVPIPHQAEIVKLIFDKFVNEGMSYSALSNFLNSQGIKKDKIKGKENRKFTDWSMEQIKNILKSEVYIGAKTYGKRKTVKVKGTENQYQTIRQKDYIIIPKVHEAIIDDETFQKAQERIEKISEENAQMFLRGEKVHLVSGILKCPVCGSGMVTDTTNHINKHGEKITYHYYACGHQRRASGGECTRNPIKKEVIEKEVIDYTMKLIKNPQFVEDIQNKITKSIDTDSINRELKRFENELSKIKKSKTNLERDIDNISDSDKHADRKRKDMNERLYNLYDKIEEAEEKIKECKIKKSAVEKEILNVETIYKMLLVFDKVFDKLSDTDKRKLIHSIISEIQIYNKAERKQHNKILKSIQYSFPINQKIIDSLNNEESVAEQTATLLDISKANFRMDLLMVV